MLTLRSDQLSLTGSIRQAFASGIHSVLSVAPTGFGKTVCFASLTAQWASAGKDIFILCHREELLDQISATLSQFGVTHGCIAPGRPNHRERRIQVASIFTLVRRLADYRPPDLLIIDEAHHATAGSWGKVLNAWPSAYRLGVTATPERLDGAGLGDTFSTMLTGPSVRTLIDDGSLSDYRLYAPMTNVTEGVHKRYGDYDKRELALALDKPRITGSAVDHYKQLGHGKRALVFCVSLDHAQHTAETFREAGYSSARIDGKLDPWTRRCLVKDFANGSITILTSCDIISEGFDLPAIEVAILLRPTQSLALYLQQVGRALRPYPGKEHAIILDHAGNCLRHGMPDDERQWSLLGREQRQASEGGLSVSVRTCGQCFGACRSGTAVCPLCGWTFPIESRQVEEVEGQLAEINRLEARREAKREQGQATDLQALIELGRVRKYKNPAFWAKCVLQARGRKKYVAV